LASLGRPPTDDEMAEEMGVSMERFEVVRRALALAEHSSDKTPALSDNARILIRFDEATWERIVAAEKQGSVLEQVESRQMQPQAQTEREQSEITGAYLVICLFTFLVFYIDLVVCFFMWSLFLHIEDSFLTFVVEFYLSKHHHHRGSINGIKYPA
jgi:hypothetical protein